MRLGRTNIYAARSGFGALPIQRVNMAEAAYLLRQAYDNGINFFDTARGYTDSEEKIGYALADVRSHIFLATKSGATTGRQLLEHLQTSLRNLRTDHVDILQLHNPDGVPTPEDDPKGLYQALLMAQEKGMIRFIGLTNHRRSLALTAARCGCYDTVQFPFSALAADADVEIVDACRQNDVGFIAMKALAGGLLANATAAFAFLRQFDNVLPIWGVQRPAELAEFIALEQNPPTLDDAMWQVINTDRKELAGNFCRGCGYCLPCPADIPIPMAARMSLLLRRMPSEQYLKDEWQEQMDRIDNCQECGHCRSRCPYGLDTPNLLKQNLMDYREFYGRTMGGER